MSAAEVPELPHGEFFISYSHEDMDFAVRLHDALEAAGRTVWRDEAIPYGKNFEKEIKERLASIKRVLVIASPNSMESPYVLGEYDFAVEHKKDVIPIYYKTCDMPLVLRGLRYIDFRFAEKDGLDALLGRPPRYPPWWVRLFRKFGVAAPIAVLATMIALAVFLAIFAPLPSKTSVDVSGRGREKIALELENRRLWRSTVRGPYVLRFPTLPIETAALEALDPEKSKVGPFGTLEVSLTCPLRGLKPNPRKRASAIADSLTERDEAFLGYSVQESNQTEPVHHEIRIPSSTIRSSLIPCIAEVVKTRGADAQ